MKSKPKPYSIPHTRMTIVQEKGAQYLMSSFLVYCTFYFFFVLCCCCFFVAETLGVQMSYHNYQEQNKIGHCRSLVYVRMWASQACRCLKQSREEYCRMRGHFILFVSTSTCRQWTHRLLRRVGVMSMRGHLMMMRLKRIRSFSSAIHPCFFFLSMWVSARPTAPFSIAAFSPPPPNSSLM